MDFINSTLRLQQEATSHVSSKFNWFISQLSSNLIYATDIADEQSITIHFWSVDGEFGAIITHSMIDNTPETYLIDNKQEDSINISHAQFIKKVNQRLTEIITFQESDC
jgi:hypothetical protein